MSVAYVGNTNTLELRGLQAAVDGAYINNATVTVTVYDPEGVAVNGETWPLSMGYVAASNGVYRASLSDELELDADTEYTAEISADGGIGRIANWSFKFTPRTRTDQ